MFPLRDDKGSKRLHPSRTTLLLSLSTDCHVPPSPCNRIDNDSQQVVAIKVLNLDAEEEDVSDIQREIATLSQLKNCDSQNITRYHGSFLNDTQLWIVMDYAAGGSIRSLVSGQGTYICQGIRHRHQFHRRTRRQGGKRGHRESRAF
jgi:serine/threonine protein kinase